VPIAGTGRIVAIDIVRGLAIMWVVLYHLWTDLRYPNVYPDQGDAFRAIPHRFVDGNIAGGLTAISDAILRVGYLGVPLFMMLSGLSLTLVTLRRHSEPRSTPHALVRRLRRVMLPYWAGFVITLAFAAALAFVQWQRHSGSGYIDYLQNGDISVDGGQLFAGALLLPRIFRDEWQFAPEGSLWFVLVIVQYYLMFPALLALMKRVGPWLLLAATLAVTLASHGALMAVDGNLIKHSAWVEMASPFRLFEFGAGMTLGYLLARRPQVLLGMSRPGPAIASATAGAVVFVAASLIAPDAGALAVLQGPAIVLAFLLIVIPLIVKAPGVIEASYAGRALAWIGVISYTVLIVSEPLRSITHTMSAEQAADGWIMLWAVAYVPLTLALARPLALSLGLVERPPARVTVDQLVAPPVEVAVAADAPSPAASDRSS
jgi:peptidoglycan/LPS O-acetylase OafA/YrhL